MNSEELQQVVAANAQAIANLRQQWLDETVRAARSQADAWDAIAQTNRTVDRVTTTQFQLIQAIDQLQANQAQQQRVLDYLLRQEQNRQEGTA